MQQSTAVRSGQWCPIIWPYIWITNVKCFPPGFERRCLNWPGCSMEQTGNTDSSNASLPLQLLPPQEHLESTVHCAMGHSPKAFPILVPGTKHCEKPAQWTLGVSASLWLLVGFRSLCALQGTETAPGYCDHLLLKISSQALSLDITALKTKERERPSLSC